MTRARVLILIPARYESVRFPGKPLSEILGKSLIQRVFENVSVNPQKTSYDWQAWVVTDDQRIEDHVKQFGGNVCRVDDQVESGSERIQLAMTRFFSNESWDLVVNVQGDEPLLESIDLINIVESHLKNKNKL